MVKILLVIILKKYVIILVILAIVLSFFLGMYLYKLDKINEELAFEVEYTTNKGENAIREAENILQKTSSVEDKINPSTKLIEKVYYNDCNHIIQQEKEITENLVNKNKEEFQIEYIGWEIQKFTNTEVVVYKEVYDFCNEHYSIKDKDGYIYVYKLDRYGKEKELIEKTDIQTKYLAEADLEELKRGITVYSKKDVNKKIEDFE